MALLARLTGLLAPLREFACSKPVWGICAGAILLASGGIVGAKKNGQEVIGGIDVRVERNGWGSQLESFEAELTVAGLWDPNQPFVGVFIRAPVILALTALNEGTRPPIKVLARLPSSLLPAITSQETFERQDPQLEAQFFRLSDDCGVAARSSSLDNVPSGMTKDDRFHEYFINECVLGPSSGPN
ncbi:hypothetical protein BS47DRAFT_1375495 [Hydnum rufescens UP504]|uniref:Glutaminase n=1 Tax=Hydnum rufescens UP504 TaxID=1448309 RepID=A0A9P6B5X4_9AGAM|nr:hypothetical protein BS47DRAFT_1375495 [Hydnum rufescens UP504]